jgi:glyoxylase-like metal-dependent hydrolase (beta-lactamase superfamily II)
MVPETRKNLDMPQPTITRHPDGIAAVDAEYVRSGLAAVHILHEGGRAAIVDTGANNAVPLVLAALKELGIAPEAVDYLLLTHVHLDHAGGAGLLMQSLPNARAFIHPRGAPHMIDPSKLVKASIAVYGEESYRKLYGDLLPIPADRVVVTEEGQRLSLAGRELEFVHTPGHALHHYAVVDSSRGNIFTGDTFGMSYRETDTTRGAFIVPTTTPSQFDPEQLIASVRRLAAYEPKALYLMHYSRVTDVPRLADSMEHQLREFVRIGRAHAQSPRREALIRAEMSALWARLLREHGCALTPAQIEDVFGGDLDLNTQGLIVWLDRAGKERS